MFTAGRILRSKTSCDGSAVPQRSAIFGDRAVTSETDRQRRKYRCYIPFVWQSVLATVAGLVVMTTGISVCIVGFYGQQNYEMSAAAEADAELSQRELMMADGQGQLEQRGHELLDVGHKDWNDTTRDNETQQLAAAAPSGLQLGAAGAAAVGAGAVQKVDQHVEPAAARSIMPSLASLSYVGPVIMSFGCFAFIFAFVVFCEARDHAIEYYIRSKLYAASKRGPTHSRLPFRRDIIDMILSTARRRAERRARCGRSLLSSTSAAVAGVPVCETVEQSGGGDHVELTLCHSEQLPCFAVIDCQPSATHHPGSMLPVSDSLDRTTDWLLSNGMLGDHDNRVQDMTSYSVCNDDNDWPLDGDTSAKQATMVTSHRVYSTATSSRGNFPMTSARRNSLVTSGVIGALETVDCGTAELDSATSPCVPVHCKSMADGKRPPAEDESSMTSSCDVELAGLCDDVSCSEQSKDLCDDVTDDVRDDVSVPLCSSDSLTSDSSASNSPRHVFTGDAELQPISETSDLDVDPVKHPAIDSIVDPVVDPTIDPVIDRGRAIRPCRLASTDRLRPTSSTSSDRASHHVGSGVWVMTERRRTDDTVKRSLTGLHCPPPLPPPPGGVLRHQQQVVTAAAAAARRQRHTPAEYTDKPTTD